MSYNQVCIGMTERLMVEFEPDEAERAGAFFDDSMNEEDALQASRDHQDDLTDEEMQ